jgi:hypothetical protein
LLCGSVSSQRANQIGGNYVLNHQLMLLSACLTDEAMTSPRIKQDGSRMPVQRKRTREDLLALRNVIHGLVVDAAGLHNSHLRRTTWWRGDVALRGSLLRRSALSSEVAGATTIEAGVARGSSSGRWCR